MTLADLHRFAASHSLPVCHLLDDCIEVGCDVIRADGSRYIDIKQFRGLKPLRDWLGY